MLVIGLFTLLGLLPVLKGMETMSPAMKRGISVAFLQNLFGIMVFVGAVLAIQGLVSNDRSKGYYRFLFAKPVSPARYYGQAFVINGVGFLVLISLLLAVYGAVVEPVLTPNLVAAMAMVWLCYAGITFLLSTLVQRDWLLLVLVTLLANLCWARWGHSTSVFARLLYLLPPLHRTDEIYPAMATGAALPWRLLSWLADYGLVRFAAGLLALQRRRLATS